MKPMERHDNVARHEHRYGFLAVGITSCCDECLVEYGLTREQMDQGLRDGEVVQHPEFSHRGCETCGDQLGGDRYIAHSVNESTGEVTHWNVCCDCVQNIANGEPFPDRSEA